MWEISHDWIKIILNHCKRKILQQSAAKPMIQVKSQIKTQLAKSPFGNIRFKAIHVNLTQKDAKSLDKTWAVLCTSIKSERHLFTSKSWGRKLGSQNWGNSFLFILFFSLFLTNFCWFKANFQSRICSISYHIFVHFEINLSQKSQNVFFVVYSAKFPI